MSDPRNPFNYPINPKYGEGVFHRKIRLQNGQDETGMFVFAELEDCNHGFCIKIYHNQQEVTAILPEAKRIPLTTCAGAAEPLKRLIGENIHQNSKSLNERLNPQANCTHWLDLSIWALAHASRGVKHERVYHIQIPDEMEGGTQAQLFVNNTLTLDWTIENWTVKTPLIYAGQPFYKGFAAWANNIQDPIEREAAFVLQKGYFVSRARYFNIDQLAGEKANEHTMMLGACYSYSEPRVSVAQRTKGTVRDFTGQAEQLLKFV